VAFKSDSLTAVSILCVCVWLVCVSSSLSLTRGDLLLAYVNTKRLYGLCRRINSWCGALSPAGEMRDDALVLF
jgi:hypothetical protein